MQIKFHETEYNLVDNPNIASSRFQCTIEKGDNTFDSIVADTTDIEEITISDEGELDAVYTGYNKRIAINIYENDNISIELENDSIQKQIDILTAQLTAVQKTTDEAIAELNDSVETITPYTAEKIGYIGDTEVLFEDVPDGILSVFAENSEGNSIECEAKKSGDDVKVTFKPLEYVTTISISIS